MNTLFAALFLSVALATPAMAQQGPATGSAAVTTNVTAVSQGTGVPMDPNGVPYPTYANTRTSGHLYTTPSVQGSYFSGANPCLIGVGGGAAGGPIGLSINFGYNDVGCQRRSDAAAWHALGLDNVAVARMCQDDDNAKALEATGNRCPGKTYAAAVAPSAVQPAVAQQPVEQVPVAVVQIAQPVPPPVEQTAKPKRAVPAWCGDNTRVGKLNAGYVQYMCGS